MSLLFAAITKNFFAPTSLTVVPFSEMLPSPDRILRLVRWHWDGPPPVRSGPLAILFSVLTKSFVVLVLRMVDPRDRLPPQETPFISLKTTKKH